MDRVIRKAIVGVSDEVRHKMGSKATENDKRLEISDLCAISKAKAVISCTVIAQLSRS